MFLALPCFCGIMELRAFETRADERLLKWAWEIASYMA
jgi:hypothetical protein